jgi:hypothetical protein
VFRDGLVEYQGDRFVKITGAAVGRVSPPELTILENAIDTAIDIEQWIGTPEQRKRAAHF